jgi:hypothetical protein
MPRYALLDDNNVVTNMVEAEGFWTPLSGTKMLTPSGGEIGDTYDPSDGSFTTPEPEEEE